jgi:hypothetical protein
MSSISRRGIFNPIKGGFKPRRITVARRNNAQAVGQRIINRVNKKRRIRARRQGIEMNRADGGFKPMLSRRKVQQVAVNYYAYLKAIRVPDAGYEMMYVFEDANTEQTAYAFELNTKLAGCTEFQNYLNISEQYKVFGVNISIDVNRIANAGDILPKMILYYDTDKITTKNPLTANNVMSLIMHTPGTKNYNVSLNKRNMNPEYIGWLATDKVYDCKLRLHIGNTSNIFLNGNPEYVRLGTVKITFNVKFRLRDQQSAVTEFQTIQQKIEAKGIDLNDYIKDKKEEFKIVNKDRISLGIPYSPKKKKKEKEDRFTENNLILHDSLSSNQIMNRMNKRADVWNTLMKNCICFGIEIDDLNDGDFNFSLHQLRILHDRIKEKINKMDTYKSSDFKRIQVIIECFAQFSNENKKVIEMVNDLKDTYDTNKDLCHSIKEEEPKIEDYTKKILTHNQDLKDDKEVEKHKKEIENLKKQYADAKLRLKLDGWSAQVSRNEIYKDHLRQKALWQEERLKRQEEERFKKLPFYNATDQLIHMDRMKLHDKHIEELNNIKSKEEWDNWVKAFGDELYQ